MAWSKVERVRELARLVGITVAEDEAGEVADRLDSLLRELEKHAALTAPFAGTDDVRARFFFRRSYTGSYALAALPAISVPCGFTTDRLPIGLQIGARPFAEETLLQVAHAYEQATRWYTHRAPAATAS